MRKRFLYVALILWLLSLIIIPPYLHAITLYKKTNFTDLKAVDGNTLNDGDLAIIINDPNYDTQMLWYSLNSSSGAAENIPLILAPTTNPGSKRWIRISIYPAGEDSPWTDMGSYIQADNAQVIITDSNSVGIGTEPSYKLHVNGTAGIASTLTMTGSAANIALGSNFISYAGTDTGISLDSSNNLNVSDNDINNVGNISLRSISSDDSDDINIDLGTGSGDDFTVDGTTLVVEGDDKQVGIGGTGDTLLYVKSSVIPEDIFPSTNYYSTRDYDVFKLDSSSVSSAIGPVIFMKGAATDGAYTGRIALLNSGGIRRGDLAFSVSYPDTTREAMRIKSTGYVGIGTADPDALLHAEKTSALTNTVQEVARLTHITSGTPADDIGLSLVFEQETSASNNEIIASIEAVASDSNATAEDGKIVFKTMAAGSAAAERMQINKSGVYIGSNEVNNYLTVIKNPGGAKSISTATKLINTANDADMDGTGICDLYCLYYYDAGTPGIVNAGRLGVIAETDMTSDPNTQDAAMVFYTLSNGEETEQARLTSESKLGIGTTSPDEQVEFICSGDENKDIEFGVGISDPNITFIALRSSKQKKRYLYLDPNGENLIISADHP